MQELLDFARGPLFRFSLAVMLLGLARVLGRPIGPDRALSYSLSLGFALHSAMMASGSFYKFLLFGAAWS